MGPKPTEVREGPGGDPWGEGGIEEGLGVFAPHHGSSASSQKRAWGPRVAGGVPEAHQGFQLQEVPVFNLDGEC